MSYCPKHTMLQTAGECGECLHEYCEECLMYPFGHSRPPLCIRCALTVSGVRARRVEKRSRPTWIQRRRMTSGPRLPAAAMAEPRPFDAGPLELPEWATR